MPTLDFKGKAFVYSHHLTVPFRELLIDQKKSLPKNGTPGLEDNLIIHGDNLQALKALLPRYAGKVKCIYIDPPYNTGNEGWCYNDNVRSPLMREWLGKVIGSDDMERHDKWLSMMWPRLQLLRELLADNGAIFISIDDNEVYRLHGIMDEIFGEENFIATVIWQKKYSTKSDTKFMSESHEYILLYAKNYELLKIDGLDRTDAQNAIYKNPDNDSRGPWASDNLLRTEARDYAIYEIISLTGKKHLPPKGSSWRFNKEKMEELIADNRIWFGSDGNNRPRLKRFRSEVQEKVPPQTLWGFSEVGHSDSAKKDLAQIFPDVDSSFTTPKPVQLLERIFQITTDENSIVLDSFAGSGTTAHAVAALNKKDGGNRKFILIECEDYADRLTAERVRRVIRGVPNAREEESGEGLGGSFTYCTLGEELNVEGLLRSEKLPTFEALARYVFYTATGQTLTNVRKPGPDFLIGETDLYRVHLIYKPDRDFLRSNASALNSERVARIKASNGNGQHGLVFATTKFMSQRALSEEHLEFCQLPYAIYKVLGD